jgi:hypothetical protein
MNRFISSQLIGVVALLASSAGMAASVTVVPSATTVAPGATFTVTVHGDAFPTVAGATLQLNFNPNVSVTSIDLAPGSTFTGGTVPSGAQAPGAFTSGSLISVLGPLVGTLPSGTFDAFTVTFLAGAQAGAAGINLFDDQSDICWSDAATFGCVAGVTYTQANVTIQAPVVPVPAAAWLLLSGLGSMAGLKRLRRA